MLFFQLRLLVDAAKKKLKHLRYLFAVYFTLGLSSYWGPVKLGALDGFSSIAFSKIFFCYNCNISSSDSPYLKIRKNLHTQSENPNHALPVKNLEFVVHGGGTLDLRS